MANLENSVSLISQINNLEMTNELRIEVSKYINFNKDDKGISNIIFRNNLHYIIDNVKKETLLAELKALKY